MAIRWIPSIGSIFSASGMMTMFLGILVFLTCFAHASSSPSLPQINTLITQLTGSSADNVGALGLAFLEAQIWVPSACFSISINFLQIDLPPFFLYYILAFLAGFIASFIFLRKASRLIDSLLAPLIASLYIVIGMVVLGFIVQALLGGFATMMGGANLSLSLDASGYMLIFLINWAFFTLGSFTAAALKQLVHHMWNLTPTTGSAKKPVKTTPKMPSKPVKAQPKVPPKIQPKQVPKAPVKKK